MSAPVGTDPSNATKPQTRMKISLLYATFFRPDGPLSHAEEWLERAASPDDIEVCFGVTDTDKLAMQQTAGRIRHVVATEPLGGRPTTTRAWNGAAAVSSGQLLFVIADDLSAPSGWDESLRDVATKVIGKFPECAFKVSDGVLENDFYMRHPVVTRGFYNRLGLFSEDYFHLFCDTDISLRAFWQAVIFDARHLRLDHRHRSVTPQAPMTFSQETGNSKSERKHGYRLLKSQWSLARRLLEVGVWRVGDSAPRFNSSQIRTLLLARMLGRARKNIPKLLRHELKSRGLLPRRLLKKALLKAERVLPKGRRVPSLIIHLPKTGGRSLNVALKEGKLLERVHWVGHTRFLDIHQRQAYKSRGALLRHPAGWYSSKLRFIREEALNNPALLPGFSSDPTIPIIRAGYSDLKSFLEVFDQREPAGSELIHLPAVNWSRGTGFGLYTFFVIYFLSKRDVFEIGTREEVFRELNEIKENFTILRTEQMEEDVTRFLSLREIEIPHVGKSIGETHLDALTRENLFRIWELDGPTAQLLGSYERP